MMSQEKFYKYIVASLVGLNVVVLAFFLLAKPKRQPNSSSENIRNEIIELLRLDELQRSTFEASADTHKHQMREFNQREKKLLALYFKCLSDEPCRIDKDSLLNQFLLVEKNKIEATYHHFQEIKDILNEDQLSDFEVFMQKVMTKSAFR
ncbi:MAG: hypothetical protein AAFY71_26565 [Bacteroidota bacterium]